MMKTPEHLQAPQAPLGWAEKAQVAAWADEATDAYRLGGTDRSWVERWGAEAVISAPQAAEGRMELARLEQWEAAVGISLERVYFRELTRNPDGGRAPVLWRGEASCQTSFVVREKGLSYRVHPGGGYSAGLFPDQRENRQFLQARLREVQPVEAAQPPKALNLFAYTGAFSVAAAAAGAQTLSIDLSARFLEIAQENFLLNGLERGKNGGKHQWWTEDVLRALPRLVRRGEQFDAIVLDPPTFARGHKGRIFRFASAAPALLEHTALLLRPGGWLLFSTNSREYSVGSLRDLARKYLPGWNLLPGIVPVDFRASSCASTLWLQKP